MYKKTKVIPLFVACSLIPAASLLGGSNSDVALREGGGEEFRGGGSGFEARPEFHPQSQNLQRQQFNQHGVQGQYRRGPYDQRGLEGENKEFPYGERDWGTPGAEGQYYWEGGVRRPVYVTPPIEETPEYIPPPVQDQYNPNVPPGSQGQYDTGTPPGSTGQGQNQQYDPYNQSEDMIIP